MLKLLQMLVQQLLDSIILIQEWFKQNQETFIHSLLIHVQQVIQQQLLTREFLELKKENQNLILLTS
ncbi:hypothetical protein D3C85_1078440 [compost metagenome]